MPFPFMMKYQDSSEKAIYDELKVLRNEIKDLKKQIKKLNEEQIHNLGILF